jgi:hypothetical protein
MELQLRAADVIERARERLAREGRVLLERDGLEVLGPVEDV